MRNKIDFCEIETDVGKGLAVIYRGDPTTKIAAVLADDAGNLSAFQCGFVHFNDDILYDYLNDRNNAVDRSKDISWAFSIMGYVSTSELMDVLTVPLLERDELSGDIASFCENHGKSSFPTVNAEVMALLSGSATRSSNAVTFYSQSGERGVRRRQAAASYPLLAGIMSSNLSLKMAIDGAKPLSEGLIKSLSAISGTDVNKSVVKRLSQLPPVPKGCTLNTVIKMMSNVPLDWIPKKEEEWHAFCHLAHAFLDDLRCPEQSIPDLIKGCGGKWDDLCHRISKNAGLEGEDHVASARQAMAGASDFVGTFSEVAICPIIAFSSEFEKVSVTPHILQSARQISYRFLAGGRTAVDVADLQRRWHQESAAILGTTNRLQEEYISSIKDQIVGDWPALSDPVQAANGLWIVPLKSADELTDEGRNGHDSNGVKGLHHCIGGYANKAMDLKCHIVSIREINEDGNYRRLSTAEFSSIENDGSRLKQLQHHAYQNNTPSALARDALSWYIESCHHNLVRINHDQLAVFKDQIPIPSDEIEKLCGYDWRDIDVLNAAIAPWGPFVTKPYRRPLSDLVDLDEVREVVDTIPPEIAAYRP